MRAVSRAAEEWDRRAFTVNEVLRMQEAGIIADEERYELIEGEIVLMQAKGPVHETIKSALAYHLVRALPDTLWFGVEATLYLNDDTFVEPDLVIYPREKRTQGPKGPDIILAIEVSASSLAYDRGFKAQLYARHKIQEYWVVDAVNRTTYQFMGPSSKNWRRRGERGPDATLTHAALPGFSIRLSDY
jgi:Uma2 family endonuclease